MSFNVLIVDDSNTMRAVIKKVIAISGFKMAQCIEAGNGKKALEVLTDNRVDVIVSDINMPEMDGFELLKNLKGEDLFKNIPVILISTESSEKRMQDAFDLGAKGFIKKPFTPEAVKKILNEVIGESNEEEDRRDDEGFDF
ncbi:MAG: response regulator [Desulfobacterales bacterium]|nr:response regulator [Desulfobacterales bacterium]MBU8909908.1 response regulator [Desulfobacterales bacterium]